MVHIWPHLVTYGHAWSIYAHMGIYGHIWSYMIAATGFCPPQWYGPAPGGAALRPFAWIYKLCMHFGAV